jgi:hypothetical protein
VLVSGHSKCLAKVGEPVAANGEAVFVSPLLSPIQNYLQPNANSSICRSCDMAMDLARQNISK